MNKFNLSDWALEHRSLVWYFMIMFAVAGAFAYLGLGREEDPSFTIKTMVIQAQWPGASAQEVTQQVTDRIEKKLQELDKLEHTRSITTAGQTIVFVDLLPDTNARDVKPTWSRVRNLIDDIKHEFPQGVVGPFFDDQFGDVYGNIFAFTADDLSQRELRDFAEGARTQILNIPDVGKVDIVGAQDEVIYLEFSTRKIAALGIDRSAIIATLQAQNAVTQSGFVETGPERVALRVGGRFISEDTLRGINLRVNDRFFPLTDVATITRGYVDPPTSLFRFNGKPAIGLAIGMKTGGNVLAFGEALEKTMTRIIQDLPVGVAVEQVSDQPKVVEEAVGGFTKALFEAVAIVLAISFISLGMRAGLVVAIAIPLVLAITFMVMFYTAISLQRISLGALIIALGLLVDDAMIAVEMMVARLEAGDNLTKAATYVYTSTAFPMLTGTLVTVAGFIPVAFNKSNAGEFTFTLFVVIAVSLVVSWVVAVVFTPLIGVTILPKTMKKHAEHKGRFAKVFSSLLQFCLRWRWMTIVATVLLFAGSIAGLSMVQQQFFPSSDRPELIVDWNLPQNSSIAETSRQMGQFEREMLAGNPGVEHWSTYVGRGAPRFVLSFDVQPADVSFGQTVIVTKGLDVRDKLKQQMETYLRKTFPGTDAYVKLLDIGPPVGKPIQYRVSGENLQTVRELAQKLGSIVGAHPSLRNLAFNWNEPARVVKIDVLQDKARQLGVSSQDIAMALNTVVQGNAVTQVRDDIYLVDVIGRAAEKERGSIDTLLDLQLQSSSGQSVPLSSVATFHYELEQPTIWRRDRIPTITIKAGIGDATQPATVVKALSDKVSAFEKTLPAGYSVKIGGAVEESA
ncbi:efflux RND transporter permease subunit, partial [Rhizobium ruizarguesonis]